LSDLAMKPSRLDTTCSVTVELVVFNSLRGIIPHTCGLMFAASTRARSSRLSVATIELGTWALMLAFYAHAFRTIVPFAVEQSKCTQHRPAGIPHPGFLSIGCAGITFSD
jgi:hypothetical protein